VSAFSCGHRKCKKDEENKPKKSGVGPDEKPLSLRAFEISRKSKVRSCLDVLIARYSEPSYRQVGLDWGDLFTFALLLRLDSVSVSGKTLLME